MYSGSEVNPADPAGEEDGAEPVGNKLYPLDESEPYVGVA